MKINEIESVNYVSSISTSSLSRSAGVIIIESSCQWRERAFRVSHRCSPPTSSRIVIQREAQVNQSLVSDMRSVIAARDRLVRSIKLALLINQK